jgi:hypothetical protein
VVLSEAFLLKSATFAWTWGFFWMKQTFSKKKKCFLSIGWYRGSWGLLDGVLSQWDTPISWY